MPDLFSAQAGPALKHWTVSEFTFFVRRLLEDEPLLQDVWITGEISNLGRASSGHLYFTLKDAGASLSCVMWGAVYGRLSWSPKQGDAVLAHGRISIYPPQGKYQLSVDQLLRAGLGDLHAQFEALCERLRAEGLFDAARKVPLPAFPRTIGVVTSPQAAALQDVLNVLRRRYPLVRVLLAPTLVQGDQAPPQIVDALQTVDSRDDVDAILLVRGGGSLEELWAFNDERVARAVAACRHPVVCGVGHETDFTIADFVADLRAPTPSAAAEQVVPDRAELRQQIKGFAQRMGGTLERRIALARQSLDRQMRALQRGSPQARLGSLRQQTDDLAGRAERSLAHRLALSKAGLAGLLARLEALGPQATLERGYAILRCARSGTIVTRVAQVSPGDDLDVQVRDGEFPVRALSPVRSEHD